MNSIRKRDYDADLERLKTFIDSYHNNDPETGKKGMILNVKFRYFKMGSKKIAFRIVFCTIEINLDHST